MDQLKSLPFVDKAKSLPQSVGVSPLGWTLALLANIRLFWKGLTGTNTLAY